MIFPFSATRTPPLRLSKLPGAVNKLSRRPATVWAYAFPPKSDRTVAVMMNDANLFIVNIFILLLEFFLSEQPIPVHMHASCDLWHDKGAEEKATIRIHTIFYFKSCLNIIRFSDPIYIKRRIRKRKPNKALIIFYEIFT